jgi:hypothetical protein
VVIRGGRNPIEVDLASSMADGCGEVLSLLTLTCPNDPVTTRKVNERKIVVIFMVSGFKSR